MTLSRNAVLTLTTLVLILTSAGFTAFSLFLPFIEAEFNWSRAMVTIPLTVSMIAWGIGSPIFGKLADDYGTRPVLLGGIVMMATGFLGMAFSDNLWQMMLTFGILVGAAKGAASISIAALLVSKHFDASKRGWAVAVVQTASPLNPLIFAPLLFLLIKVSDWRTATLVISASLWFVALPLAWMGARDPDTARIAAHQRAPWNACRTCATRP
jgi:MFS family permease